MNRLHVAAITMALLLAGCSRRSAPVIQVGSQTVTVADFDRAARNAGGQYMGPPELNKAELLDDLRRRALLVELAHRLGRDTDTVVTAAVRDDERRLIVQRLYAQLAPQSQQVSEAEVRALYQARNVESHVHLIYTSSRTAALDAIARLRAGESFARVAPRYSLLGVLPPDGDMGFVVPGTMPDPLDDALRELEPGDIGGPYRTREGWFVMQVSERRPREQPAFETLRSDLHDLLRQRKFRASFNRAYNDLKAAYEVEHVPGGSQLLFRLASPVSPTQPTEDQLRATLATYRGGRYTLRDAIDDLNRPEAQAPPMNLLPAVEIWIEAQVMGRIANVEARRRRLHEEPDVVASVRARRDQALLQGAYDLATAGVQPASPEQVALFWERMKPQFTRLEAVKLSVIESPDSALLRRVADGMPAAGTLAAAAAKVPGAPAPAEIEVTYPNPDPEWAVFEALFTQIQPGGRYGPAKTASGWRILQLVEKRTAQQQWAELPEELRQRIAGSANEMALDERFKQFTDSLATAYQVRVDTAAVARLRWPSRPPGPGM